VTISIADDNVTQKLITGLTSGKGYIFKVRARNIYGYGPFSNLVTIRASDVPDVMQKPTTIAVGKNIIVSWVKPVTGGEIISKYEIEIYKPAS
jgi:hypothetical protein